MKTFIALVAAALTSPAFAGGLNDTVVEQSPAVAPVTAASGGMYAYGMLGHGKADYAYSYFDEPATEFDGKGTTFTLGLGRDLTSNGSWAFGIEADITGGKIDDEVLVGTYPCLEDGCSGSVKALATVRGVAAYNLGQTKVFATLGLAGGKVEGTADVGACGFIDCSYDDTLWGWTAGVGAVHRMSDRWSLRGDLLFTSLEEPEFSSESPTSDRVEITQIRIGAQFSF